MQCLPMTHKKDARLICVEDRPIAHDCYVVQECNSYTCTKLFSDHNTISKGQVNYSQTGLKEMHCLILDYM